MRSHTLSRKPLDTGAERETLRKKGQFWTPDWVAEAMVGYAVAGGSDHVFDPAVGAGAFFRAAKTIAKEIGKNFTLLGTEIDQEALRQAGRDGLTECDLSNVQITDFILHPPKGSFKAIVGNPPYIRHHRLSSDIKAKLKRFGTSLIGTSLDGRAGLHIYFLLRALQLLDKDGRLAFIMPADTCEGVFSSALWEWIARNYRLDAVVTFTPNASPFPGVDTNAVIFLIRSAEPAEYFRWAKCAESQTAQLKEWTLSNFEEMGDTLTVHQRRLSEALTTGLSREPMEEQTVGPILADFAQVMRGIATGANEFFFLTVKQASELEIPDDFLIPAIGRTRDVPGDTIRPEIIKALEGIGRPTLLFSPDGSPMDRFPTAVQQYLRQGEALGFHKRTLIATRRPWYKMEARPVPPILFAYLGRRHARFIRNFARVVPLTGFLCVYPRQENLGFVNKLWAVVQHPETIANLPLVGKSYGAGAIKVEPPSLERLPLPNSVVLESGLDYQSNLNMGKIRRQPTRTFLPLT